MQLLLCSRPTPARTCIRAATSPSPTGRPPLGRRERFCRALRQELELDRDLQSKTLIAALELKTKGWTTIYGVLPESSCRNYVEGLWDWLESLGTGIDRNNPDTWSSPAWPSAFRGIINTLAVSHQPFVWRVRKHARLRQVFSALWGTTELLSSFDSINCSPPKLNGSAGPSSSWLHTDLGPNRQTPMCIQGLLNMSATSATTTGTILLKDGSHQGHARFWRDVCQKQGEELAAIPDFYIFGEHEKSFYEQFPTVTPAGPAGSLFLWDSRTAHANVSPEVSSDFRHVVYTCFQPREFATAEDLDLKRIAYEQYRVTTHWPAYNVALFPEGGSEYYEAHELDKPRHISHHNRGDEEDALLRRLAGVEPYPAALVQRAEPLLDLSSEELQHRLDSLQ